MLAASAVGLQACSSRSSSSDAAPDTPAGGAPAPETAPEPPAAPQIPKYDLPDEPIFSLPEDIGDYLAWTVDDGADPDVTMAYAQFAEQTGTRLTFFVNGVYEDSWRDAAPVLAPLIASGQVQIANHTLTHASLTDASDAAIQDELMRNHEVIEDIFGVDARPYYRPPYGYRDERTDAAAAAVGYTAPVMWYGSLGDSGLLTPEVLMGEADKWLLPGHIVLGHANAPTVTGLFPQLLDILAERNLQTVTLDDVYRR